MSFFLRTSTQALALIGGTVGAQAQDLFVGQNENQITQLSLSGTATTFATGLSDISSLAFDPAGIVSVYAAGGGLTGRVG